MVRSCPPHSCAWDRLLDEGIIEYLDKVEELGEMKVALSVDDLRDAAAGYTHAHLHPCFCLGVCGSLVPFCEFNQSPRNMYQCQMAKQTLASPIHTWHSNSETKVLIALNIFIESISKWYII